MTKKSKWLMITASLLLLLAYVFPVWQIILDAPQYPEGIGLKIKINTITGTNPHDLQNINRLNHYIGMKEIVPDAIPELKVMPFIVAFLIVFGLIVGFTGKKSLLWAWMVVFLFLALIGMVDFYLWEYDYGHNLDPHAAIKIPGMSYQPPLIGTKQLLNMKTTSLPDIGGIAMVLSVMTGAWILFSEIRSKNKRPAENPEKVLNNAQKDPAPAHS